MGGDLCCTADLSSDSSPRSFCAPSSSPLPSSLSTHALVSPERGAQDVADTKENVDDKEGEERKAGDVATAVWIGVELRGVGNRFHCKVWHEDVLGDVVHPSCPCHTGEDTHTKTRVRHALEGIGSEIRANQLGEGTSRRGRGRAVRGVERITSSPFSASPVRVWRTPDDAIPTATLPVIVGSGGLAKSGEQSGVSPGLMLLPLLSRFSAGDKLLVWVVVRLGGLRTRESGEGAAHEDVGGEGVKHEGNLFPCEGGRTLVILEVVVRKQEGIGR